jgi:hypothetical protein
MSSLRTNLPPFVMHGARAAMAAGLAHIEQQVTAIEMAVAENPGLAFDLAKTLVESACKTAAAARQVAFEPDCDMVKLFKATSQNVPFLPPELSSESGARKSLQQTLSGLSTALQGVCELRNAFGFASHGSDGPRPAMEYTQALLAAQAADGIVGFLYCAHAADIARSAAPRLEYGTNPAFNEWLDSAAEQVRILDLTYHPSEVLFSVDNEAYPDKLAEFSAAPEPPPGDSP